MSEINELLDKAVRKLVYEYSIQIEELTEEQTASALRQALECGDFQRLVQASTGGQTVVYIPFAREQELRGRIAELENTEKRDEIITQAWRHKVHVLSNILSDVKNFLEQVAYSKGQSDELLRRIDEVKL